MTLVREVSRTVGSEIDKGGLWACRWLSQGDQCEGEGPARTLTEKGCGFRERFFVFFFFLMEEMSDVFKC